MPIKTQLFLVEFQLDFYLVLNKNYLLIHDILTGDEEKRTTFSTTPIERALIVREKLQRGIKRAATKKKIY